MTLSERFWRLQGYLRQPLFEDEELNRRAALLTTAYRPILLVTILVIPSAILVGSPWFVVALAIAMLTVEGLVWWLFQRGQMHQASLTLIGMGWSLTVLPAFLQGGITSPFTAFTLLWAVVTGLLLERRYLVVMLSLNLITVVILFFSAQFSLIPMILPPASPLRALLVYAVIIYNAGSLVSLATSNLSQALSAARQSQAELTHSNAELIAAREEMEERVRQRTTDLEHRAHALQASSEVVRAIVSIRDIDALLDELTHLLSEQFDFYHVGVLLLEESQRAGEAGSLVMRAANTEFGRRLQEAGFNLPLDQTSVVGTAVRTRKPYLAADVSKDLLYLPMEEFSATRAELALPLLSGEKALGALDLQSSTPGAVSTQDLSILQTLANQIAIAIENAQLFNENQRALESLQRAYSSLSQEGWQRMLRAQSELGYRAGASGGPAPVTGDWPAEMRHALDTGQVTVDAGLNSGGAASGEAVMVPIKIREQVMGVIRLRKPPEAGNWSRDEINLVQVLSDRLSTALESARLYEETRRRAERERLTGEITARMRASNDPQAILQIAARELRKALQADKAQLIVTATPVEGSQNPPQGGQP